MRFTFLLSTFIIILAYGCGQPHQNNKFATTVEKQDTTIVKYDENSITKSFSSEGKTYSVKLSTVNLINKIVRYSDQLFLDREIVLSVKSGSEINYVKRINKEIFLKQSEGISVSKFLIYKATFSDVPDPLFLFSIDVNFCMPETDDCYFFQLNFNKDGEYRVKRVDVQDEGVE